MLPPGLSMLWESADAPTALRERFGFTGLEAAAEWLAATLSKNWGVTVRGCERLVISGQNAIAWVSTADAREPLICKWSRDPSQFARLAAIAELLGELAARGVPVAAPRPSRSGKGRQVGDGPGGPLSLTVQAVVHGEHLDLGDEAAVRAAGSELARLHLALSDLAHLPVAAVARTPEPDLKARVEAWSAQDAAPEAALWARRESAALPPLDSTPQLVHNDFRAANLITNGSRISAILDFDELALDHCVSDLAIAGVHLGTLFHDWAPTPPQARTLLIEGYQSVRALSSTELTWLDFLTRWYSLVHGWPAPDAALGAPSAVERATHETDRRAYQDDRGDDDDGYEQEQPAPGAAADDHQ